MRDNKQLTKIVAASLLGDGHVSKKGETTTGQNSRFRINLLQKNQDHIAYLKQYLEELTHCSETVNQRTNDNKDGFNRQPIVQLVSGRHPFYTKFRERMYPHGYKIVDPHYLTLVDWEFLAIVYQQDGTLAASYANKQWLNYRVSIATLNFSYGDNLLLKQVFKEKLGLEWNVSPSKNKAGARVWFLRLMNKQLLQFINGIEPYVQPSFRYKIELSHGLPIWATKPDGDDIVGTA